MLATHRFAPALLLAASLTAAPACAAERPYYAAARDHRDFDRRVYDDGYRQGFERGQRDARQGREFQVDRAREYRDAERRAVDDRAARLFADGYRRGYSDGYGRAARDERRDIYPYPARPGVNLPGDGRYGSPAAQTGYRDGLDVGRDDAREHETYNPWRSKRYRDGDRGYDRRFGPREAYKQEYRQAFVQGYDEGYRGYRW